MNWNTCIHSEASGVPTISCLEPLFANIVTVITSFAAIALFIMLVYGGYKYLSSGGDPKKAEAAKSTLTYAMIGFVLIIGAFLIIRVISSFTGLEVLESFNIKFPQ